MPKKPERYQYPHTAVIKFQIKVHKNLQEGGLDPVPVSDGELRKYGIDKFAAISVSGFDKIDCIKKLKEKLEKLNG